MKQQNNSENMNDSKGPIRLRKRKLKTGNTSLYLDIYYHGKRRYEYLNLYLIPEKTRADKERNKETLRLADAVRSQRVIDFQNGRFDFDAKNKPDTNFLDYFRMLCEKRRQNRDSLGNWRNWHGALVHLEKYCRSDMTFRDVTPEFINGFKDYLGKTAIALRKKETDAAYTSKKPIADSTKWTYFSKFRACINSALADGIISQDPLRGITGFKRGELERVYLTLDEVKAMIATECKCPALRNAFLFSCLTGLRKSDIEKMKWSEVRQQGEFTRIVFKQKKTGGQEYIDINPQAVSFMGAHGEPDELVFPHFKYTCYYNTVLRRWAAQAGVKKDITFHSGRHTFAVMMLDLGADIYTVQKLLGHKELQTTQIYAKVLDKKKQEAAMLIPPILPIGTGGNNKD